MYLPSLFGSSQTDPALKPKQRKSGRTLKETPWANSAQDFTLQQDPSQVPLQGILGSLSLGGRILTFCGAMMTTVGVPPLLSYSSTADELFQDRLLTRAVSAPFFAVVLSDTCLPLEFNTPPQVQSDFGVMARPPTLAVSCFPFCCRG